MLMIETELLVCAASSFYSIYFFYMTEILYNKNDARSKINCGLLLGVNVAVFSSSPARFF